MSELVDRLNGYADAWDDDGNTPDIVEALRQAATTLAEDRRYIERLEAVIAETPHVGRVIL